MLEGVCGDGARGWDGTVGLVLPMKGASAGTSAGGCSETTSAAADRLARTPPFVHSMTAGATDVTFRRNAASPCSARLMSHHMRSAGYTVRGFDLNEENSYDA
jgi:hypothetical protein